MKVKEIKREVQTLTLEFHSAQINSSNTPDYCLFRVHLFLETLIRRFSFLTSHKVCMYIHYTFFLWICFAVINLLFFFFWIKVYYTHFLSMLHHYCLSSEQQQPWLATRSSISWSMVVYKDNAKKSC